MEETAKVEAANGGGKEARRTWRRGTTEKAKKRGGNRRGRFIFSFFYFSLVFLFLSSFYLRSIREEVGEMNEF